jgi:hypothetical protein
LKLHWFNDYSFFKIILITGLIAQGLMKSLHNAEKEVFGKAITGLRGRLVVMEIDLVTFDGPPKTFGKDIIACLATTVHADTDIFS